MTLSSVRRPQWTNSPARTGRPPGPRGLELLAALRDVSHDRLRLMTGVAQRYGDVSRIGPAPKGMWFLNHPDHAKHVLADNAGNYQKGVGLAHSRRVLGDGLLTGEGAVWQRNRKTITPTFQRERLARLSAVVAADAGRLAERWRRLPGTGPVDVMREMTAYTLGVLGHAVLDTELDQAEELTQNFYVAQDQAMFEMATFDLVPLFLPLPRHLRFRVARRNLRALAGRILTDFDARDRLGDDLLSRLARDYAGEPDRELRDRRLSDEVLTMLIAGQETTANTLTWTWYEVGRHPEVAERVREEAHRVLGDRPPAYEDLRELTYTAAVVDEALRLHPPVWILPRRAVGPDTVAGYRIRAGADVLICPYTLHRHPDFWDDPERFDPDRFTADRPTVRHRYAYIPFGAGPRFCVGNNLGMMEAVFGLATLAREFRLEPVPGHQVSAEPMMSLRVRGGLPATVHRA